LGIGNVEMTLGRIRLTKRDPKVIRAWATSNGIEVPRSRRIPADVERRYDEAHRLS
jgi:Lsr2